MVIGNTVIEWGQWPHFVVDNPCHLMTGAPWLIWVDRCEVAGVGLG